MYANYLRRFSKIYLNFHESEKSYPNTKRRNFEMIIFQNSKEPGQIKKRTLIFGIFSRDRTSHPVAINRPRRGGRPSCSLLSFSLAIYRGEKFGDGEQEDLALGGLARNNFADCQIVSWFCLGPEETRPNFCGLLRQQFEWRLFGIWNKRISRA